MKDLHITVEDFLWIAPHPQVSVFSDNDKRIVVLEKPEIYARLDPTTARVLAEYPSIEELLGSSGKIMVTMLQDPNHFSFTRRMFPMYYEVLSHLNMRISPFRAFCLEGVPLAAMPPRVVHSQFCLKNKKSQFKVALYA